MGCSASRNNRIEVVVSVAAATSTSRIRDIPLSHEQKCILREFWELVEPVKSMIGKKLFKRLFECNPRIQDVFPVFKSLKLEDVINSRSLYLHVRRVMTALENAVFSLNDAEVFMEYLMNLGERHKPWSVRLEHFDGLHRVSVQDGGYGLCWSAAILDLLRKETLGKSLTHSQSDDRRSFNLDTKGLISDKMHGLCRRDMEGTISLYNCNCDERTEESRH